MGVKAEGIPRFCHCQSKNTSASLGYPLLVFNKNSTLKATVSVIIGTEFSINAMKSEEIFVSGFGSGFETELYSLKHNY